MRPIRSQHLRPNGRCTGNTNPPSGRTLPGRDVGYCSSGLLLTLSPRTAGGLTLTVSAPRSDECTRPITRVAVLRD